MRQIPRFRRGVTAVLAMLYLVLFSSLAIGFYAATNTAAIVTENERRGAMAAMAAESGMEFIRYQLAQIDVPHGTHADQLFPIVYNQLVTQLIGTSNMSGKSISCTLSKISIPSGTNNYINLENNGGAFRVEINNLGQNIVVKVVGKHSATTYMRAVQMNYGPAEKASNIFDFGVASKGKVTTGGSSEILGATDPSKGSVLSACLTDPTPVDIQGKKVSGDISVVNPSGNVLFNPSTSIGGTTDDALIISDHIHKGVGDPEFPTIDTDAFKAYVTSTWTSGKILTNCKIPANSNPQFTGGATIRGVCYVETPNNIKFGGNLDIQGVIVVQNDPTGNPSTNVLNFTGTVSAQPINTLPASYGDLRNLTGSFVLAPNFTVAFSGNFGTLNGSIIADKITMSGNATGTVQGSVIGLQDMPLTVNGSSEIIIASTGTTNYPAGVFFSSRYVPLPDTYEEVQP